MLQPRKSDLSSMTNRPRCLEGTRQEYLDPIMKFLFDDKHPNIFWLTGAAGSGKSTIAVTTSDMCGKKGSPPAHMFFEREKADPTAVVRTIAYTLAESYPSLAQRIFEALQADKNLPSTPIRNQFEKLLLGPICATDIAGPAIVVLDALDECGTAAQRRELLELLTTDFAKLPSKVRVLITSRPEDDIMEELQSRNYVRRMELQHKSDEGRRDVNEYIRREMTKALGKRAPSARELDGNLQVLNEAANGLFIWASTAVKMVASSDDRRRKLDWLAKNIQSVAVFGIDGLYATALAASGVSWDDPVSRKRFSSILGLVLVAKEAMTGDVIEAFLGAKAEAADLTLSRLQSVVSYEPGKPIRLHHASFADYLLSPQRSGGKPWHVEETERKQDMTERCFDIMATNLRFNICGIESSFIPNSEVPGLQERIDKNIPPYLSYACRFWSLHMCELENPEGLTVVRSKLGDFANARLLYWLEVLSLTDCFTRVAGRALNDASSWIEVSVIERFIEHSLTLP